MARVIGGRVWPIFGVAEGAIRPPSIGTSGNVGNILLNSAMLSNREGNSISVASAQEKYVGELFKVRNDTDRSLTASIIAGPVPGTKAIRLNWSGQGAASGNVLITQYVETVEAFADSNFGLSSYFKSAVLSPVPQLVHGLIQQFGTGGSADVSGTGASVRSHSAGDVWTRYKDTIFMPSIAGKTIGANNRVAARCTLTPRGSGNFDWGCMALEYDQPTDPFRAVSLADDMAKTGRYFQTNYTDASPVGSSPGAGAANSFDALMVEGESSLDYCAAQVQMYPDMRITPAVTVYSSTTGAAGKINRYNIGDATVTVTSIGPSSFACRAQQTTQKSWGNFYYVADARY